LIHVCVATRQTDREQSVNNRETEIPPQPAVEKTLQIPAEISQPAMNMDNLRARMREECQNAVAVAVAPINAKIEHNTKIVNAKIEQNTKGVKDMKTEIETQYSILKEDTMKILDKYERRGAVGKEIMAQMREDLNGVFEQRIQDHRSSVKAKKHTNKTTKTDTNHRTESLDRGRILTRQNTATPDSKRQKTEEQGHFKDPSTQS
jgi:hypothetical protein